MRDGLSFSEQIRAASWGAHEDAATGPFMRDLVAGDLPIDRYADLVAQHYFAYAVLEDAGRKQVDDPIGGVFVFPELERIPALEADLRALLGDEWRGRIQASPATEAYCERMRDVCFDWPGGFVAHHYVRYLGDLSGGQIIRKLVEKVYRFAEHAGSSFYVFDRIEDRTEFKASYRDRLDAAPWDDTERERITAEILRAYELSTRVLAALDGPR